MKLKYPRKYYAEKTEQVVLLNALGMCNSEIAKKIGMDYGFVKNALRRKNIKPSPQPQKHKEIRKCAGCVHCEKDPLIGYNCAYILNAEKPRGCEPDACDKYSKDKSAVRSKKELPVSSAWYEWLATYAKNA